MLKSNTEQLRFDRVWGEQHLNGKQQDNSIHFLR